MPAKLQAEIERLYEKKAAEYTPEDKGAFAAFIICLNDGRIRAAEPDPTTTAGWRVNAWVKKGILLGFRMGRNID
ncbi:MAG TPA: 2,3,4,5-tetrahydropyridine-2,6-dicarboxylate N-succinyltransferase, partial [Bryobacteraceae bacterium]